MKKILLCFLTFILLFSVGCDNQGLICAHLSDATQGLSTNYAVRMVLDDETRVEEKYVELQIKSTIEGLKLNFGEEGEEKQEIVIDKADEWYNITVLQASANGMSGKETYEKYSEKGNMTYLFTTSDEAKLTFRVVIGEAIQNDDKTGYILTATECISNELKISVKKAEE